MTNPTLRAKSILEKISYITIASVDADGLPWNAPVFGAYDADYNFYWGTHRESQKAKNIRNQKNIFFVVYDSTVPAGKGEGVYVRAVATEVTDPQEIPTVYDILSKRHGPPFWKFEYVQGDMPIRLYKAVPEKMWVNDGVRVNGAWVDTRIEVDLNELRR